ncbi:MAG: CoA transferase, partial [Actinomycetota bacterium]
RRTGEAVRLDVSMLDAGLLFNAGALVRAGNLGVDPPRTGNAAFSGAVASGAFETTDGLLMVAANKASHLRSLLTLLGLDDLLADPSLTGRDADPDAVAAARTRLGQALATRSAKEWEGELNRVGVPAARVRSLSEVVGEGHPAARGLLQPVADQTLVPGAGFRIDGVMPGPSGPVPEAGGSTVALLRRFGFGSEEIDELLSGATVVDATVAGDHRT